MISVITRLTLLYSIIILLGCNSPIEQDSKTLDEATLDIRWGDRNILLIDIAIVLQSNLELYVDSSYRRKVILYSSVDSINWQEFKTSESVLSPSFKIGDTTTVQFRDTLEVKSIPYYYVDIFDHNNNFVGSSAITRCDEYSETELSIYGRYRLMKLSWYNAPIFTETIMYYKSLDNIFFKGDSKWD